MPTFKVRDKREREFIGTNIKQYHAKIKLRRWNTEKNLQNRLFRRAPLESFINKFLSWFKVDGRISAILIRL